MNHYAVIDADGMVVTMLICDEQTAELNAKEGQTAVLCSPDIECDHYYQDGQFIRVSPQPSEWHKWNPKSKLWEIDLGQALEDAKAQKRIEIRAAREQAEYGGFTWDGSRFDSDVYSQSRLLSTLQLAQISLANSSAFGVDWKLADNTSRHLSAQDLISVCLALSSHVSDCHALAQDCKAMIDAAQSLQELSMVHWPEPLTK
jgi:hypothetical protein